jgi:hypothetical protein
MKKKLTAIEQKKVVGSGDGYDISISLSTLEFAIIAAVATFVVLQKNS